MTENVMTANVETKVKRENQLLAVLKRLARNKAAMLGLIIFLFIVVIAILAPYISKYPYDQVNPTERFSTPSLEHPFGTDQLGRDILSRMMYGARYSLAIGIIATLIATAGGVLIGSISGFFGGTIDQIIMRICDVIQAIPGMVLNIALAAVLGEGFGNCILALGIGGITGTARLVRASILSIRKMEYLDAATAINCRNGRIIWKHALPNAISPLIVNATMGVAQRIMTAASLSYLGLGVQPPNPEWGAMLTAGRDYIQKYPYLTMIPGVVIMVTVLSLNLLGDGLRDALDPKLKK